MLRFFRLDFNFGTVVLNLSLCFQHLSKSHLLPLAGAALVGIAAALLVNPVLLQLGTVTGKRRRRRDTARQSSAPAKSLAHNLAYSGHIH